MNKLILIRGLPGSGKSTRAKKILQSIKKPVIHCEADFYHYDKEGKYNFKIENAGWAHARCMHRAFRGMELRYDVIVSNTFTTISEMKPYILFAKELNIPYKIIECKGKYKSIHGVPKVTIQKMKDRWEKITKNSFKL